MISKYLTTGGFAIVILCFLMPFVSIKCNDMELVKVNGYELIIGKDIKPMNNPMKGMENTEMEAPTNEGTVAEKPKSKNALTTNWFMVTILLSAFAGLIFSLQLKKSNGRVAIILASLALVSQILFVVLLNVQLQNKSGAGGDNPMLNIKLSLGYNFGFWLMLLALLFIIGYNIYNNMQLKQHEALITNPITPTEPEQPQADKEQSE
jgi:hypothetical protein